jgi:tetratricopeptide (TPR) repeat protein
MIPKLSFLILLAALGAEAASQRSEFATGRACYVQGEFKKAVAHFQLAIKVNPADADSYYWIGMSYRVLADIAFPFAGKYASKARVYLTRATELEPGRLDYRRELFNCLLDSAGSSRTALRRAAGILRTVSPNDPDYERMRQQFEQESKARASADARLGRLFLAVPRAAYRIADLATSAPSTRTTPPSAALWIPISPKASGETRQPSALTE